MKDQLILIVISSLFLARFGAAGEPQKLYYLGEAKISSSSGQPMPSQVILAEKTHDPDRNLIVERAVVVKSDKSVEQYTMTMTVSGDSFTLNDDANTVTGSGTLFGPTWHWTYFHAVFQATNGAKIEDENFMADDSVGVARKKVCAPDGKVIMYMDITMKSITPKTFELLSAALLKK